MSEFTAQILIERSMMADTIRVFFESDGRTAPNLQKNKWSLIELMLITISSNGYQKRLSPWQKACIDIIRLGLEANLVIEQK